jgi:hypothetical protein
LPSWVPALLSSALRTLHWKIEHVVVNLFYLHARKLNVYAIDAAGQTEEEVYL